MTDREERQHVIKVLKNMLDWMEAANMISSKPERIEAVKYAIASIETDLKYDLLYEETIGQADKPITKNCESCRYYGSHHKVCNYCYKCSLWAEQEPTTKNDVHDNNVGNIYTCSCGYGWDKSKVVRHHFCPNCGKAVEPTTKENLAVDAISRADVLKLMQDNWHTHNGDWAMQESMDDIRALPSVTPQESRWIPVSEKLPNDRNWYLGIFKEPDTGWINPLPFICDYVGRETKATTKEHWILRGFTDWDDYHIDYYFNLECVAWMPLPKPFGEVDV